MRFTVFNPEAERREGLKALLRQIDRQARFSEAHDWRQADRTLRRLNPDLLVIDWENGMRIADARALFAAHPTVPVAVLTDDASPSIVRALIDEGALGVIPRRMDHRLIVRAFEIVLLGGHYVPAGALALEAPPAVPEVPVRRREAVLAVLRQTYGESAQLWFQRWRLFWMACAELFGYAGGQEWLVAHYRFVRAADRGHISASLPGAFAV